MIAVTRVIIDAFIAIPKFYSENIKLILRPADPCGLNTRDPAHQSNIGNLDGEQTLTAYP